MPPHSDSRPSTAEQRSSQNPERTPSGHPRRGGRWNPYVDEPDLRTIEQPGPRQSREAIPPPQGEGAPRTAASVPSSQTNELLETLSTLTDKVKDATSRDAIVDTVKKFAKTMQQKVARLGGVTPPTEGRTSVPANDVATSRFSAPPRNSLSNSLDGYRPDRDVTAPISVRPNAMELLWVCGDCGQHYPRARECPDVCTECGAPKQHFYAPIED